MMVMMRIMTVPASKSVTLKTNQTPPLPYSLLKPVGLLAEPQRKLEACSPSSLSFGTTGVSYRNSKAQGV